MLVLVALVFARPTDARISCDFRSAACLEASRLPNLMVVMPTRNELDQARRARALSRRGTITNSTCERKKSVGTLILPASGQVYLDANPIIDSVEKYPAFDPLLQS